MENCEISIAMATYQGGGFIRQQIESLLGQSKQPCEIVICDDGSTDDTCSIITEYLSNATIRLYKNDHPLGVIGNFAKAISLCNSPYISLCDQDDFWMKQKLEKSLVKMMEIEKDTNVPCLVFGDLEVVDQSLNLINQSLWKQLNANPGKDTFGTLLYGNVVTGCSMMINKSMSTYLTRIPEKAIMHDYWAALIAYGFGRFGIIEEPLVKYRQHGRNVTNNYRRTILNRLSVFAQTYYKESSTFLMPEIDQAEVFMKLFSNYLSNEDRLALQYFVSLKKRSFYRRKWESIKSNQI